MHNLLQVRRIGILFWLSVGLMYSLAAQVDTLMIRETVKALDLSPYFESTADSLGQWTFETVDQATFLPLDSIEMPLPLSHRLWSRIRVYNQTDSPQVVVLGVGSTDSTVVYWEDAEAQPQKASIGGYTSVADRNLPYGWNGGARVSFAPGKVTTLYLLTKEFEVRGPNLNPNWQPYAEGVLMFHSEVIGPIIIICLFLGGILFTLLYNLIVAANVRSLAYLYYSLYLLSIGVTFYFVAASELLPAFGSGQARSDDWAESSFFSLASLFYMLFGRSFLNTAKLTPRWDYVLRILIGIRLLISLAAFANYFLSDTIREYIGAVVIFWFAVEALVILIYIVPLARMRYRVAWFFIVGSVLVFLGGFMPVWLTSLFGVLVNNAFFVLVSVSLEVLVFSLGLGYKMRQQQQDKLVAEQALNHELQKVNTAFGRFVPHAFLESLGHQSVLEIR